MPSSGNDPRRIAVVVNSLTGDELKAGNRDVSRIYSLLTDSELGACSNDSPKPLHECKSRNEFQEFIEPVIDNWHLHDQFIFYFSGHGMVRNGRYCLQIGTSSRGLPFDSLMSELDASGVQRAIIILDACHSGAAIQGVKDSDILSSINKASIPKGIAIIASSRARQTSHEMPNGSASVFTDLLCRGIETGLGEQCTSNGLISVDNIVSYISNKLKKDKKYSPFRQHPVFTIDKAEQPIWIAKNKSGNISESKTTRTQKNIRTPEELNLLYEKTIHTEHPCIGASLDDLNWSLVETYATKLGEDKNDIQDREILLAKLKFFSPLVCNPTLHQAAVLCFAMHPERMYSQAKSNFVLGDQGGESFDRHEVKGSLSIQIKELLRRTTESLRKTSSIADSGERIEKHEIDPDLIRELISNAVTHRDYRSNSVVRVTVNSDYIEIQNPGAFPNLLSWTELLKCSDYPVSKPVNGAISQYLAHLLMFEGIGRGFRVIHDYITEHGKESIEFKELPGPTSSVRILRPRDQNIVQGNDNIISGIGNIHITSPHHHSPPIPLRPDTQNISQGNGAIGKQVNYSGSGAVAQSGSVAAGTGGVDMQGNIYMPGNLPQASPVPRQLPYLDACFLGRDRELAELVELLHPGKVVAVCGPGGMGKSALAARAVHQLPPARFPDGIIFHSFYHQPKTESALQAIVAAFQIEEPEELESIVRATLSGKKALLILDGTEEAEDLQALLGLCGTCGVLITSRKRTDARAFRLVLTPLEEKTAAEVLREHSQLAGDDETVQGICKILAGWPVGLRIAGRYLSSTGESAADYLRWLEQEPLKELGDGQHQDENVALLLSRSVAQVSEDSCLLLGLVGSLAFAPLAIAPMTVLIECDERRTRKAVNELVNYGLLERQGERYQVSHALIHTYARTKLALNKERLQRLAAYYIEFCQAQNEAGLEGYAHLDKERAHCLRLLAACLANELWREVKALMATIEEYLDRQGHWSERLTAFNIRLTAAHQAGDRRDQRHCLGNLGYTCLRRGELEQALYWSEQSLAIDCDRGNRQGEAVILNNIGDIYRQQGNYEQAQQYLEQSLNIRQELVDRVGEGTTLNNIGLLYWMQGRYEQAQRYYQQALSISREMRHKILEGSTLDNIATIHRVQGEPNKALKYHQQALAISRELGDRLGEAQSCLNIGLTCYDLGDMPQTEEYLSLAVEIAEAIEHPALEEWRKKLGQVREKR